MIIKFNSNSTEENRSHLRKFLHENGFSFNSVKTQSNLYGVSIGKCKLDIRKVGAFEGVEDVFRVSDTYKLVSRKWRKDPTIIDLGDGVKVGEGHFGMMMGPCSIESEEQVRDMVNFLSDSGVRIMRGGAFKPRSSPYSFQGMGLEGLKMFSSIAHARGLKIISEVLEPSQIDDMMPYVDIFQVGARNNQNFSLLKALGSVDRPVLLKRGISGTLEELLNSAEYIYSHGNERILLCERGIRTFEGAYRNVLDINAIPVLKAKSHLPVIVDPSHGIGLRECVEAVGLAGIMAGADGVIVESHARPEEALSDGQQTLNYSESKRFIEKANRVVQLRSELNNVGV
jgi:3-deoxy-7-phosphoheptulonate synthase